MAVNTTGSPTEGYDRTAASAALAGVAGPEPLFPAGVAGEEHLGGSRLIVHQLTPLVPEPGRHLTSAQRGYLEAYMRPCPPSLVTSATHRVTWADSDGIPNVAHAGPSALGPVVPIVARETTLALWRDLAANGDLAARIAGLDAAARRALAATTTDQEPMEIFRIAIEAANRTLVQHAYLADRTPARKPADFARLLRDSGIFGAVASRWYWELQASTFRRGMIPVSFVTQSDGSVRYSSETLATLREMKERTIADAREVMARATGEEGLTVHEAVQRYHHELDIISKQYALLRPGEQPRCLGQMTHTMRGRRCSLLPGVVHAYVETFVRLLDLVEVAVEAHLADRVITNPEERIFHVPDMNCRHCQSTIAALLESMDISVSEVDLVTKRIDADFRTLAVREHAFDAIRDAGYTVVPPGAS